MQTLLKMVLPDKKLRNLIFLQRRTRVLEFDDSSSSDTEDRVSQFFEDFLSSKTMPLENDSPRQGSWSKRLIRGIYKRKGQIDDIT